MLEGCGEAGCDRGPKQPLVAGRFWAVARVATGARKLPFADANQAAVWRLRP